MCQELILDYKFISLKIKLIFNEIYIMFNIYTETII